MTELDIQCLPKDLPEFIEVDVGGLEVGQTIHVADLKLPKGVRAGQQYDEDAIVVGIVGRVAAAAEGEEGGGEAAAE